jgi:hypothetical protein
MTPSENSRLNLRVGEVVEVRSEAEILSTLDANGHLEGLPFMPEMLKYCGQRVRVYKSAHKTCDTIQPGSRTRRPARRPSGRSARSRRGAQPRAWPVSVQRWARTGRDLPAKSLPRVIVGGPVDEAAFFSEGLN